MISDELKEALSLKDTNSAAAIELLGCIVKRETADEEYLKEKEVAIMELASVFSKTGQASELVAMIKYIRPFLGLISKAKAAKLVKNLVDMFLDMDAVTGQEVELCRECIDWAKQENRTFLKQALEVRLISLYIDTGCFTDSLTLCTSLLRELKKLDDKALLVEVQLLESKAYHALENLPRSRAALTSARTTANGIYCPPKLQASLDLQSGILHAAQERDFKTAYSYFYEAFEGYDSVNCTKAVMALKYMLLSKIMLNCADDVPSIVNGKLALRYSGIDLDAMKLIAQASHNRSLSDFHETKATYKAQLENDPIIRAHLDSLYDNLLERNLCRIIEPFSQVQVERLAQLINLPTELIEKKLSGMILDKKITGILDQGNGVLVIFDEELVDKAYDIAIDTVQNMGKVVDALYTKANRLA